MTTPKPPSSKRTAYAVLAVFSVLVIVVAVAAVVFVLNRGDDSYPHSTIDLVTTTAVSTPSLTTVTTSAAPTPLLANGVEAPRTAIPWTQVGKGWAIVRFTTAADVTTDTGPSTLYLVNPIGGRYNLVTLANGSYVVDWSGDRQRVLLYSFVGQKNTLSEFNLVTAESRPITVTGDTVAYTRPLGKALLTTTRNTTTGQVTLDRLGLDGAHQQTYPITTPKGGSLTGIDLYTPDGADLIASTQHGMAVFSNAGDLVRELVPPTGYSYCVPRRWWADAVIGATCYPPSPGVPNVWAFPISGAAPTAITTAPIAVTATSAFPFGFTNAWKSPSLNFVVTGSGCGPGILDKLNAQGLGEDLALTLPSGVKGTPVVVAVYDDHLLLRSTGCSGSGASLFSYNPTNGGTTVLLGPGLNGGTAVETIVNPDER
jgi:hypothetical protein